MTEEDEEMLADLLVRWEDELDAGRDISADELCGDRKDLVETLAHRIQALKDVAWIKKDPARPLTDGENAEDIPPITGVLDNRYRLETRIAVGGFGEVYRAFDEQLHRSVAVKIARAQTACDLLMDEARKVARLRHPGIVAVHDVGEHDGRLFLVFDLIEGRSLADLIEKERLPIRNSVEIVVAVAEALHFAHSRGCIHRDIKPDNILIDEHGKPLVADFGVAITFDDLARPRHRSSGTLPYMAPEQIAGEMQLIDVGTDIHGLGVVLFELLTGRLPYSAETRMGLREEILLRSPKKLHDIDPTLPEELDAICSRCLAKHPDDRFKSAQELANALNAWLHPRTGGGWRGLWELARRIV